MATTLRINMAIRNIHYTLPKVNQEEEKNSDFFSLSEILCDKYDEKHLESLQTSESENEGSCTNEKSVYSPKKINTTTVSNISNVASRVNPQSEEKRIKNKGSCTNEKSVYSPKRINTQAVVSIRNLVSRVNPPEEKKTYKKLCQHFHDLGINTTYNGVNNDIDASTFISEFSNNTRCGMIKKSSFKRRHINLSKKVVPSSCQKKDDLLDMIGNANHKKYLRQRALGASILYLEEENMIFDVGKLALKPLINIMNPSVDYNDTKDNHRKNIKKALKKWQKHMPWLKLTPCFYKPKGSKAKYTQQQNKCFNLKNIILNYLLFSQNKIKDLEYLEVVFEEIQNKYQDESMFLFDLALSFPNRNKLKNWIYQQGLLKQKKMIIDVYDKINVKHIYSLFKENKFVYSILFKSNRHRLMPIIKFHNIYYVNMKKQERKILNTIKGMISKSKRMFHGTYLSHSRYDESMDDVEQFGMICRVPSVKHGFNLKQISPTVNKMLGKDVLFSHFSTKIAPVYKQAYIHSNDKNVVHLDDISFGHLTFDGDRDRNINEPFEGKNIDIESSILKIIDPHIIKSQIAWKESMYYKNINYLLMSQMPLPILNEFQSILRTICKGYYESLPKSKYYKMQYDKLKESWIDSYNTTRYATNLITSAIKHHTKSYSPGVSKEIFKTVKRLMDKIVSALVRAFSPFANLPKEVIRTYHKMLYLITKKVGSKNFTLKHQPRRRCVDGHWVEVDTGGGKTPVDNKLINSTIEHYTSIFLERVSHHLPFFSY